MYLKTAFPHFFILFFTFLQTEFKNIFNFGKLKKNKKEKCWKIAVLRIRIASFIKIDRYYVGSIKSKTSKFLCFACNGQRKKSTPPTPLSSGRRWTSRNANNVLKITRHRGGENPCQTSAGGGAFTRIERDFRFLWSGPRRK